MVLITTRFLTLVYLIEVRVGNGDRFTHMTSPEADDPVLHSGSCRVRRAHRW